MQNSSDQHSIQCITLNLEKLTDLS